MDIDMLAILTKSLLLQDKIPTLPRHINGSNHMHTLLLLILK